ncbi:6607_t:CDS:2 [Ambispora gerdemannii]|uniref:6607_t:CDS:1 n=1 Tax=Ambispora gerdemannii TaxID=144530 RepID=A0A9N9G3V0_9GLOM|nr:6607_t:CDS:2 [Ambispora gerdemannii]
MFIVQSIPRNLKNIIKNQINVQNELQWIIHSGCNSKNICFSPPGITAAKLDRRTLPFDLKLRWLESYSFAQLDVENAISNQTDETLDLLARGPTPRFKYLIILDVLDRLDHNGSIINFLEATPTFKMSRIPT